MIDTMWTTIIFMLFIGWLWLIWAALDRESSGNPKPEVKPKTPKSGCPFLDKLP